MKLQEMMEQGYTLQAWAIYNFSPRGERRIMARIDSGDLYGLPGLSRNITPPVKRRRRRK